MFPGDAEYAAKEAEKLIGYQIVGVCRDEENDSYGFVVQRDPHGKPVEQKLVWIDMDPEGNGPGWISVEDHA